MKNKSYTYIMPILSEWINLSEDTNQYIVNTYLFTNKNMNIGNFYIECKFNYKDINFSKIEKVFTDNELYIKSDSVESNVLYHYNIPDEYIKDVILFVQGKYSEISKDLQLLICNYWIQIFGNVKGFIINNIKHIKQVFAKSKLLKKEIEDKIGIKLPENAELKDIISVDEETFKFPKSNNNDVINSDTFINY